MQQTKGRMLFTVLAFALAILRAAAPVLAAEKPTKLRTAYVSPIGAMAPVWMAAASSAFQTEGLDLELVYIQSSSAIAALVAGEVDAVQISAPAIVPAVVAGGNITMIAGLLNKMIFSSMPRRSSRRRSSCGERLWAQIASDRRMITESEPL